MNPLTTPGRNAPQTQKQLLILWLAMLTAVPVYFVLTRVVTGSESAQDAGIAMPMLAVALLSSGVGFFLKNRLLSQAVAKRQAALIRGAYTLAFAMSEIPALLGMVVYLISGWPQYWAFFVISLLLFALHFPSEQKIESHFQEIGR